MCSDHEFQQCLVSMLPVNCLSARKYLCAMLHSGYQCGLGYRLSLV